MADSSTKLELFFARAPHRNSAAPQGAMHGSPQATKMVRHLANLPFHEEIWPSRAPACSRRQHLQHARATCSQRHRRHGFGASDLRIVQKHQRVSLAALRARRGAQTVVARRLPGAAGKALLQDRGNGSKRCRLDQDAHSRAGHLHVCFAPGGRNPTRTSGHVWWSVVGEAGGKNVSNVQKKHDVPP